jgi:hypothetical protein
VAVTARTLGDALLLALFLTLPLVVSGSFHMLVVRRDWLAGLARPISEVRFGRNKTIRGFVVMAFATVPGVLLARWLGDALGGDFATVLASPPAPSAPLLGVALGLAYAFAELPNSYLKRRLGIPPGKSPDHNRVWFTFLDQADSAMGCALVYALLIDVSWLTLSLVVLAGPAVHLVANMSLYAVGLRREAF